MNELISIIIPVYNVEKYLCRCVDSVLAQSYGNIEVILIDDGSPDRCGEICDSYAERDSRVKVIHKANGGQGEARNFGMDASSGDYIGFVDSDDFIAPKMYERLLDIIHEQDADAAECRFVKFDDDDFPGFPDNEEKVYTFSAEEAVAELIRDVHFTSTVPNMLIKREIALSVKFQVGVINEDVLWPYRVLSKCRKASATNTQLYAYRQRAGSTMNSAYSAKRFDGLNALQERAEEIKRDFPALYCRAAKSYVGACMYNYQYLCRMPKSQEYEGYKKELHQRFISGDRKAAYSASDIKYKLWYSLFSVLPGFTCRVRNMLGIGR